MNLDTDRGLTVDELRRLLTACDGDRAPDLRDTALIWIMASTGWQPGVILDIPGTGVWDRPDGPSIHVHVRERSAHIGGSAAEALRRWLGWLVARDVRGAAFQALSRSLEDHRAAGRLSVHGLRKALKARARDAGVENFTPRRLRYTFARLAVEAGWPEPQIWLHMTGQKTEESPVAAWTLR